MLNSVAKNTKEDKSATALDVINLQTFQAIFHLQGVCFNQKTARLEAWFSPDEESADEVFDVHECIFKMLQEVKYTEGLNTVTVVATKDGLFVSTIGNNDNGSPDNLAGSVAFAIKMNPERFPKWAKHNNGILKFRLNNGQEYQFQCAK